MEAAAARGRAAYVAAARDMFIAAPLSARLPSGGGAAAEVWADAPPGVAVADPCIRARPGCGTVAGVITDIGIVGPDALATVAAGLVGTEDARRLAARLDASGLRHAPARTDDRPEDA